MQQFELFEKLESSDKEKGSKTDNQFANQILKFKRSVLFVIYSLVVLMVGFILGVEHNKNSQAALTTGRVELKKTLTVNKQAQNAKIPGNAKQDTVKYTIQVGSYKNIDNANLVRQALKKQGFSAYLVNSKPYIKVYVGPYKSRIEAEEKLKALKKKYPDSFIK